MIADEATWAVEGIRRSCPPSPSASPWSCSRSPLVLIREPCCGRDIGPGQRYGW